MGLGMTCERSKRIECCQHVDRVFRDGDRHTEREKNLARERQRRAGWSERDFGESLSDVSYEVKAGEPSKLHLTTRMVTSSLKSSPQKFAAAL